MNPDSMKSSKMTNKTTQNDFDKELMRITNETSKKIKIEKLKTLIDNCLDNNDKDGFMKASSELIKIQRR